MGVHALGLPAEHGGFGAGPVELVLAFEQLGRFAVPGPLVESIAALPPLLAGTPAADQLDAIGSGTLLASVALPPHVPFALDAEVCDAVYLVADGELSRAAVGLCHTSVDAARLLAEVTAAEPIARVDTERSLALGALATAAQIHGAGRALLQRSVDYAKQRTQFGTAIGRFQAVKHQLADASVGLELSRPLLFGAALTLAASGDASRAGRDVSAAKVACTDAAYRAARTALQVHGAIGYTAEYDLSLWLTKVRALVSPWGTQSWHRARVLAALRAERTER